MEIKSPHAKPLNEILKNTDSGNEGISKEEAEKRLAKDGPNALKKKKRKSKFKIFMDQFRDFMVIILLVAAVISVFIDPIDAGAIMVIVILNAIFGYVQENKAEEALEALKKMAAPSASVIRGGVVYNVPAEELVVGDLVMLEAGSKAPADIRLLDSFSLEVDESSLTGESVAVQKEHDAILEKDSLLGDRKNMCFSSCIVEAGRGKGYVVATGMDTQIGKIAGMIQEEERPPTPLQVKLDKLGKQIGYIVLAICAVIFIMGYIRTPHSGFFDSEVMLSMLIIAVSLAVAAIPEGLPAVVTISLALGLQRMAAKHAIIRQLPSVETLGSTQVICSDKTGTLTKGEMTVRKIWTMKGDYEVTGTGFSPEGMVTDREGKQVRWTANKVLENIAINSEKNSNAKLMKVGDDWEVQGTSTEGALVALAKKLNINLQSVRLDEKPFDSNRKRMSTLHAIDGKKIQYTKGAPDFVLPLCNHYLDEEGKQHLTESEKSTIQKANDELASQGYRVLLLACRENAEKIEEEDLTFLGLVGLMDPPRMEVKEAVKECNRAGIEVVMITGDHHLTAVSVAKEIGIFDEKKHRSLTGRELEQMSVDDLAMIVEDVRVYARVSPQHKVKIVKAWKKRDKIVAMTGDGVNDAPALRKADIGIAMGITGTDVSKEASVMILTDDNFASIVEAVEEGRGIYDNIRKFVTFLLSCNGGEVLTVFIGILLGLPLPLLALQILWINLVTDGPPALALGVEPISEGIMEKKPRDPKEHILNRDIITLIILISFMTFSAAFSMYYLHLNEGVHMARTCAFVTLIFSQNLFVLSTKNIDEPLTKIGIFSNKWLIMAIAFALLASLPVIYLPFFQNIFETDALGVYQWVTILTVSVLPLVMSEMYKYVRKSFA